MWEQSINIVYKCSVLYLVLFSPILLKYILGKKSDGIENEFYILLDFVSVSLS